MVRDGASYAAVSAVEVDDGIDTGPVIMQKEFVVTGQETGIELRTIQERANVDMLLEVIPQLPDESFTRTSQDMARRSYRGQPTDDDYRLDFEAGVDEITRLVRAGYRHPGAYAVGNDGSSTIILSTERVGGAYVPPLESPGIVRHTDRGLLVAAGDEWIRLLTIDHEGHEVAAESVLVENVPDFVGPENSQNAA